MSQGLKQGKKPLSKKPAIKDMIIREDDLFGNPLTVPPHVAADIEKQGKEARWVDARKIYDNHGYHAKGWMPYKKSDELMAKEGQSQSDFKSGADPDGTLRHGSLILAVKPKEAAEKHRQLLKQKAERQKGYNKQKAAEFRQMAKEGFKDAKKVIFEGYDDEDGTEVDDNADFDE